MGSRFQIVFSDDSSTFSADDIPTPNKFCKGNNEMPKMVQPSGEIASSPQPSSGTDNTSPFEIFSSDEYSEPNPENKIQQSSSSSLSRIEQFYNDDRNNDILQYKPTYNAYIFTYKKKKTVKGFRYHFQLTQNGIPLYHSKTKNRHTSEPICISSGRECHFSQTNFAGFLAQGKKNQFMLYKNSLSGQQLMNITIKSLKGPIPKEINVVIHNYIDENPKSNHKGSIHLVNMKPEKDQNGRYSLSFDGKYAIPSVKNCILVADGREQTYISARRISSTSCEIDALSTISSLCIFGFVLSSFVSSI